MIPFDTLKYARNLEMLGVPRDQAEGQTRALFEALSQFVAVRSRLDVPSCRPVLKNETVKPSLPVRLDAVPGRQRQFVDWLLLILLAVNVALSVAFVVCGQ